jgi:hypothetical protein
MTSLQRKLREELSGLRKEAETSQKTYLRATGGIAVVLRLLDELEDARCE